MTARPRMHDLERRPRPAFAAAERPPPYRRVAMPPAPALWLGAAGLLPVVLATLTGLVASGEVALGALAMLRAFAVAVLSFLGGVHWGLAMADTGVPTAGEGSSWPRLGLACLPVAVAWLAFVMPWRAGLVVLALAFAALLLLDIAAAHRGMTPPWYPTLRAPLSAAVILCLLLAAAADPAAP